MKGFLIILSVFVFSLFFVLPSFASTSCQVCYSAPGSNSGKCRVSTQGDAFCTASSWWQSDTCYSDGNGPCPGGDEQ